MITWVMWPFRRSHMFLKNLWTVPSHCGTNLQWPNCEHVAYRSRFLSFTSKNPPWHFTNLFALTSFIFPRKVTFRKCCSGGHSVQQNKKDIWKLGVFGFPIQPNQFHNKNSSTHQRLLLNTQPAGTESV
jgi:hypothetical protein